MRPPGISRERVKYSILRPDQIKPGMKDLVGAKAESLRLMRRTHGLAVPPFIVVTSRAVSYFMERGFFPEGFHEELSQNLIWLEKLARKEFNEVRPYSVRGGARVPLPGLLPTALDVDRADIIEKTVEIIRAWETEEAGKLRLVRGLTDFPPTAIVIQQMVYGDLNRNCASGVYYSRGPRTGIGDGGEVVIQGRGPEVMSETGSKMTFQEFAERFPQAARAIRRRSWLLSYHWRDALEVEFTVENKKPWFLQAKELDRSAEAAVAIAHELASERRISWQAASKLVQPHHEAFLLADRFDPRARDKLIPIASGRPVSPGGAVGKLALTRQRLETQAGPHIFVAEYYLPGDASIFTMSEGVVSRDHVGAHTRSWALGSGIPAITAVENVEINVAAGRIEVALSGGKTKVVREGEEISICGDLGHVYASPISKVPSLVAGEKSKIENLALSYLEKMRPMSNPDFRHRDTAVRLVQLRRFAERRTNDNQVGELPEWRDVKKMAAEVAELKDMAEAFLEAAYILLLGNKFGLAFGDVLAMIMDQGWGQKEHEGRREFITLDDEKAAKFLEALYYLDVSEVKRVCEAFCKVEYVDHGYALRLLSGLDLDMQLKFVEGMIAYVRSDNLPYDAAHFLIPCFVFMGQDGKLPLLSKLSADSLAFLLGGFYVAQKNRGGLRAGSYTSSTIKSRMPRMEDVLPQIRQLDRRLLHGALDILDPTRMKREHSVRFNLRREAFGFWQKELLLDD